MQQFMMPSKRSLKFLKRDARGVQPPATCRLNELSVKLWVEHGDTDALRAYADASESWAAHRLLDVLAERGDFEAFGRPVRLRRRARLRPPPFHVGRIKVSA
uniref:hypothetical protein n=1 Tax=Paractinoplanes polyasparticus TaxID=2856853 RepID=UPI001C853EBA|nr:hypothetical protein [Actinoplanes polyasparticus]